MRSRTPLRPLLALATTAALAGGALALAPAGQAATAVAAADPVGLNAPYEYLGWGSPQKPTEVMAATGVKQFTLAFMLSDGGCNPKWDGTRALTGGSDQSTVNAIRSAGGDVVVSFGGWSGNKLGEKCGSASALAAAYQKVVDAYRLKAIDIDIESTEVSDGTVRQRVVDALRTVRAANPGLKEYVTFGTTPTGPDSDGLDLIRKGAAAGLAVDGWTIMPFDFGSHSGSMGTVTTKAADGLKNAVARAYGYDSATAYRHIGISSMNGRTDEADETVSTGDFTTVYNYATAHHLARFTFWAVNRDRACASGASAGDSCSGIGQSPYAFTKIVAKYHG
ncbi:chitinase [Kitasatospora sp. NPDC056138]|uniref:chitinase n=1 Tax=Kitasatospora sp. NPDC056138 TaxID=3345724 RepID=UPI0035E093FE